MKIVLQEKMPKNTKWKEFVLELQKEVEKYKERLREEELEEIYALVPSKKSS